MKHILTAALAICMATTAAADKCAERHNVVEYLTDTHNERVTGDGVVQGTDTSFDGIYLEVWANASTGTFTITLSDARGRTCIWTNGAEWQTSELVTQPEGSSL